ncbi:MAG: hypothetical protein U0361_02875 [Nitrospiraceae bacterium]
MKSFSHMAAKSGVVLPVAPALPAAETTWLAWAGWMAAALPLCLMGYAYYDSLAYMTDLWVNDENYGHATPRTAHQPLFDGSGETTFVRWCSPVPGRALCSSGWESCSMW